MRKHTLLSFIFILFSYLINAQQAKVLFLGNSYTQSNNLPEIIKNAALLTGDTLIYEAYTPGGKTLKQHAEDPFTQQLIAQGDWDYVVIQGQSQEPSFPINYVQEQVLPYAHALSQAIKATNPCTEILFYTTWGRENGDDMNCPFFPPLCTYEGMDDLLTERYILMAEQNEGIIIPVGPVWRSVRSQYPNIPLYTSDESHPSTAGSYLAAMTFYSIIFNKETLNHPYHFNLDPITAASIQNVVNEIAFQQKSFWTRFASIPQVDFNYEEISSGKVHFINLSNNVENYHWDFGNGHSSEELEPVYQYEEEGTYNVTLTAQKTNCSLTLSKTQTIHIESSIHINENHTQHFILHPNPTHHYFSIQGKHPIGQVNIYNMNGIIIASTLISKPEDLYQFDISSLPQGIYFVHLYDDHYKMIGQQKLIKR